MFENKKQYLVLGVVLLTFFILISSISAATNTTITNSTGDGGIKKAINDGNNIINLEEGIYTGENNSNLPSTNNSSNITINGVNSNNHSVIDCNGKIFIDNQGNLTLINLIIKNAHRGPHGGAIYNNGGNLTIINCTFLNCTSGQASGAIINVRGAICILNNSNFTNNKAGYGEGAVGSENSILLVYDTVFVNNSANDSGGAIGSTNRGFLSVVNCKFIDNSGSWGGAIQTTNNTTIINSTFINNKAKDGNGGAISGYNCNVINSSFINNSADSSGGAIHMWKNLIVNNSEFINNNAELSGGAIHLDSNAFINCSLFINNFAKNGGAINKHNGNLTVINSTFANNKATVQGGALRSLGDIMNVSSSIFIYNHAENGGSLFNNGILYLYDDNRLNSNNANNTFYNGVFNSGTLIIINSTKNETNDTKIDSDISISSIMGSYSQLITLTTKLSSNNNILVNKKVNFYVNGKLIGSAKTNSKGLATLKYKIPSVAKYTIKTIFDGDSQYNKIESSIYFSSNKAKTLMTLKNKLYKNKIYVKVSTLGKPLKNKFIKFYVKGKYVGKAKTNSNGLALFKYSKKHGKVTVKTVFSGDKLYNKVYKTSKIKL
ncbi:MAG: hypothetical protein ACRCVG_00260 [Methanobacteriaceae archaeon]